MSERRRCVWMERREGRKVLCVTRRLPAHDGITFAELELFAVVRVGPPIRGKVFGCDLNRVIEALEYVPDQKLGHAVGLLEAGFMVCR